MSKICIILVYFGPFPKWLNLWLLSCYYNSTISFLIVTDQDMMIPEEYVNVHLLSMNLSQMKDLADQKLRLDTALTYPYKCCDLRPAYGLIFEDYLKGYDFWGHCDCDLIFGDLRKYFTEDRLRDYDRIFGQGHLSIYRNTSYCNRLFKFSTNYKKFFSTARNFGFDENLNKFSIGKELAKQHIPVFFSKEFADIETAHNRFLTAGNKNFTKQIFYWNKGRIYRDYKNEKINIKERNEFSYIHFQKRKLINHIHLKDLSQLSTYIISSKGFFQISDEDLKDIDNLVTKYNFYPGFFHEKIEAVYSVISYYKSRLTLKIYNMIKHK